MSEMIGERYRLLVLGSGRVGKTSLIRRYLHNTFPDRYKETVEDIFARDFRIRGAILPLDIYDTNFYYPDMRKVSITSANAFLLVFAVDNVNSFKDVTELVQEISERRPHTELANLPMILVGNKSDAANKKIYPETVQAWLSHVTFKSIPYLETSALNGDNVVAAFKSLLIQSGFPNHMMMTENDGRLCRPLTQVGARSPSFRRSSAGQDDEECPADGEHKSANEQRIARFSRTLSRKEKSVTPAQQVNAGVTNGGGGGGGDQPQKPLTRHGSLMRKTHRLSLKIKHAPSNEPDESDCIIS